MDTVTLKSKERRQTDGCDDVKVLMISSNRWKRRLLQDINNCIKRMDTVTSKDIKNDVKHTDT